MVKAAIAASKHGLSVLPITPGTKKARVDWKKYQAEIASEAEIQSLFHDDDSFAVICGKVSGNLELIDFDIPGKKGTPPAYEPFRQMCIEHGYEDLINRLVIGGTPSGGIHIVYRCESPIEGNQKLATNKNKEVTIETRGEGGYFLTWPTPGYTKIQGKITEVPTISADERSFLLEVARFQNEHFEQHKFHSTNPQQLRPGDIFNERANWESVLTPHGWKQAGKSTGGRIAWVRPGKDRKDGISATTGNHDGDWLYVHTSNAPPFEPGHAYTKFAAYVLLNHRGDYIHAAQELRSQGYGQSEARQRQAEQRRAQRGFSVKPLESFSHEYPDFLWEPYLRRGQINLLDAKGGAGKTTLVVALAVQGSIGRRAFSDEEHEPYKTLYFGKEDTAGELRVLYDQMGGKPGYFFPCAEPFQLNEEGLMLVEETIEEVGAQFVVFDSITYYVAKLVRNPLNGMEIEPHLSALREVARATKSCILNIRHFSRNAPNVADEDKGSGSEQWRNSHRSQLVLQPHPDIHRYGIVKHAKGSLNSAKGAPFGFHIADGIFGWIRNPDLEALKPGREQKVGALADAERFLKELNADGTRFRLADEVQALAKEKKIGRDSYYAALKSMNIQSTNRGFADKRYRLVWPEYDPYADTD